MTHLALATVDTFRNGVWHMDAETLLRSLPDQSIDLIVTSPPYNLRNSTGNGLKGLNNKSLWTNQPMRYGYDGYSDDMPHDRYVDWQRAVLAECMRVLTPAGAIFYNHKGRVQNGLWQDRQDILDGFPVRQPIIWYRGGGINFNESYFLPTYETIYLICKPDFRLVKGANASGDVWSFQPSQNKEHPNAFPLELPMRCINATKADIVLDPFAGSGTTLKAAQLLGRDYIGCDISATYVEAARQRLTRPETAIVDKPVKVSAMQPSLFPAVTG